MISSSTTSLVAAAPQISAVGSPRQEEIQFPYLVAEIATKYAPRTLKEEYNLLIKMVKAKEYRFNVANPRSLPISYIPVTVAKNAIRASTANGPKLYAKL